MLKRRSYGITNIKHLFQRIWLDLEGFKGWRPEYKNARFELETAVIQGNSHQVYRCGHGIEKMSKSLYNVVNPNAICAEYGADTLRLFEMFLGPLEQSKPWITSGIEGVQRFTHKLWRWVHGGDDSEALLLDDRPVPEASARLLHQLSRRTMGIVSLPGDFTAIPSAMVLEPKRGAMPLIASCMEGNRLH